MSSLSVAPAVLTFPRFTHTAPNTVDLTLRLVVDGDPTPLIEALREFVDQVNRAPAVPAAAVPAVDPGAGVRIRARERTVLRSGTRIDLTRREFDLLLHLATHPRQVFTRAQLLRTVWGDAISGDRTVDVHIARLRRKLAMPLVETVRGVGYRLSPDAPITLLT